MKWLYLYSVTLLLALPCAAQTHWPLGQFRTIDDHNQILAQQLSSKERRVVRKVLCQVAKLDQCKSDEVFRSFQMERTMHEGAGSSDLIVMGSDSNLCSPTGNCSFLVLDKTGRILLNTYGVQGFVMIRHILHGRSDIVTSQHGSATESTLRRFRFDGHKYYSVRCAEVIFGEADNPNSPPHVTAVSCAI